MSTKRRRQPGFVWWGGEWCPVLTRMVPDGVGLTDDDPEQSDVREEVSEWWW